MNNKKLIRLTESDLHRIVKESVNKVLNEVRVDGLPHPLHGYYGPSDDDKRDAALDFMSMRKLRKDKAKELDDASNDAFDNRDERWHKLAKQAMKNRVNANQDYDSAQEIFLGGKQNYDIRDSHFDEYGNRKW